MAGSERCLFCGAEIPEGRQVCPDCERSGGRRKPAAPREILCETCRHGRKDGRYVLCMKIGGHLYGQKFPRDWYCKDRERRG